MAARVASSVSATVPVRSTRAPACVASAASVARVGVVQLARAQRAAGRDQLVARGQHADAGRRAQATRPAAGDDGDADLGRAHAGAGGQDGLAGADVVARRAHVAAGRRRRRRAVTVSPSTVTSSTCSTASAPSGIAAPVEMRTASPSPTADGRRAPPRATRRRCAARARRARPHGEAVHRAVGERGHVAVGDDVLGQHAAERVLDRDVLGGQRVHGGEHLRARLVDGEGHAQIIAAVGRGWYPGCDARGPVRRPAPASGRRRAARSARGRPGAGQGLAARARGRAAAARRPGAAGARPRARRPRRCARRSCARSAPTPSCAGWQERRRPRRRWPRAPARWRARAGRRGARWPPSRRCAAALWEALTVEPWRRSTRATTAALAERLAFVVRRGRGRDARRALAGAAPPREAAPAAGEDASRASACATRAATGRAPSSAWPPTRARSRCSRSRSTTRRGSWPPTRERRRGARARRAGRPRRAAPRRRPGPRGRRAPVDRRRRARRRGRPRAGRAARRRRRRRAPRCAARR